MPQICFLYVDNDPDACTILSSFCERIGTLTIKTLNSGEVALEWLATSTADVIVSDYRMPGGMDGMMLLRTLHARGNTTPFIFFAATDDPAARKKAFDEGAFGFIGRNTAGRSPIYPLIRAVFWAVGYTRQPGSAKRSHHEEHGT